MNLWAFVLVFAISTPLFAQSSEEICSEDFVVYCDNFEQRDLGQDDLRRSFDKSTGWDYGFGGPEVTDEDSVDGSRSLVYNYPAGDTGIGLAETLFPPGAYYFIRFYTKFGESFEWSPIATKHTRLITGADSSEYDNQFFIYHFGFNEPAPYFIANSVPDAPEYHQNAGEEIVYEQGQWYCQEIEVRMHSANGIADGMFRAWVNGTLIAEYENIVISGADSVQPSIRGLYVDTYWNSDGDTHGEMQRFHDNYVVATQRVGCLGEEVVRPANNQNNDSGNNDGGNNNGGNNDGGNNDGDTDGGADSGCTTTRTNPNLFVLFAIVVIAIRKSSSKRKHRTF